MKRRALPGVVAPIAGPITDAARHEAVVHAAIAYVVALRDWTDGVGYAPNKRERLHRAQRELVAAVAMIRGPHEQTR